MHDLSAGADSDLSRSAVPDVGCGITNRLKLRGAASLGSRQSTGRRVNQCLYANATHAYTPRTSGRKPDPAAPRQLQAVVRLHHSTVGVGATGENGPEQVGSVEEGEFRCWPDVRLNMDGIITPVHDLPQTITKLRRKKRML